MPWITDDALAAAHQQHNELRRRYIQLSALYAASLRALAQAEAENARLWERAQGTWLPLWEENTHLYQVLTEQLEEMRQTNGTNPNS